MDKNTISTPKTKPIKKTIKKPITEPTNQLMEEELFKKLAKDKSVHIVLKSFNKTNEHKYLTDTPHILAIDKNLKCGKLYLGFKHITDKIDFIERWKHQSLYEIITNDIVKPYVDIDYKIGKYKTDEQVKIILTDLITEFNNYYLHKATIENTYCYGKRDKDTKLWKSIHIVIDKFMATKDSLKDFCEDINSSRSGFKLIVGKLDSKVYTHNRCFSFLHQRKMGGEEFFEWIYCWDCDDVKYSQTDITYKYLINDVSEKTCVLNYHYDAPSIYGEELNNKIIKKECKVSKRKTAIETKELVIINQNNIVDELLLNLPTEFYDSSLWFKITIQIILHGYVGTDKWLKECAEISNENYTHDQNKKFAENISDDYYSNNIQKKLDELNDTYGLCLIWDLLDTFTEKLKLWVCDKSNTDMIDLNKAIMNYKDINQSKKHSNDERLIIGNNFIFNMRKQTLSNDIDKIIFHYGLDTGYDNQYGVDTTKYKTITQDEIKETIERFMVSSNRLVGFKMLWGSGKTHFGVDTINKYAMDNGMRILFITENNNLNTEMTTKFSGLSHLDKNNLKNIDDFTMVICSLESLKMVLNKNSKDFDIIIFDEYESIIQHLLSTDTFKSTNTTPYEVSCLIKDVINTANKIICLDCDLSEERMNLITNIFKENNDDERPQLYNCSHNSWADYQYRLYDNVLNMRFDMKDDIFKKNKRVIYATGSKADAKNIYQDYLTMCEADDIKKNMLVIHADDIEYFVDGKKTNTQQIKSIKMRLKLEEKRSNKDTDKIALLKKELEFGRFVKKDQLFKNLERVLIELNIEVFIYSPSIKCGISFGNDEDNILFDKCYGYSTNGSVVAREFLQMLHRCRHLKDKQISFNVKTGLTATSQLFKQTQIDNLIDKNQQLKFNPKWSDKNYDGDKYSIEEFYKSITNTNFKEMMDSQRNITQEILGKLKFNHGLNVSIKSFFEIGEKTTKVDYDDTKEQIVNIKRLLYRHEKKLSPSEYQKAFADKATNDSYEARRKYNTLQRLKLNNSNSKYLRRERLFEKEKRIKYETPQTSGIYENYITNKNGETFFCFGSSLVKKEYFEDDCEWDGNISLEQLMINKNEWMKWKLSQNEKVEQTKVERILKWKVKPYIVDDEMLEEISIKDYDLDILAQHTKQIGNLTFNTNEKKINHLLHLRDANNEIISDYIYEEEQDENDFTIQDINTNKLKIIKQAIDILGVDRKVLIKKRKIITNKQLKKILDNNSQWVNNDLLIFINEMDTKTVGKTKLTITNYKSSNKTYYKYVKNIIIGLLSSVGFQTQHYNKSGGIEKNNYENDVGLLVIQYELGGKINGIKRTFINTYYDNIDDEIFWFHNGDKINRDLPETITEQEFNDNLSINKRHSKIDNKYNTYRKSCFKRNRYAIVKIGDIERSVKIPFNIFNCDFCYDNNNTIIDMKDKTDDERVVIYIKIELNNPSLELTVKMTDITNRKNDIQFYKFYDVGWKQTDDNYYVKERVVKLTTDKEKRDNIINQLNQTTEEVVSDALNDIIETIEAKDKYKHMVEDNINMVGEQRIIEKSLEECRVNGCDLNNEIDKEIHFKIHRPNIFVKLEDTIYDSDDEDED